MFKTCVFYASLWRKPFIFKLRPCGVNDYSLSSQEYCLQSNQDNLNQNNKFDGGGMSQMLSRVRWEPKKEKEKQRIKFHVIKFSDTWQTSTIFLNSASFIYIREHSHTPLNNNKLSNSRISQVSVYRQTIRKTKYPISHLLLLVMFKHEQITLWTWGPWPGLNPSLCYLIAIWFHEISRKSPNVLF